MFKKSILLLFFFILFTSTAITFASSDLEDKKDKEKIQSLNGDLNTCYETIMKNENMMKFNAAKEGIDALVNKITMIIGLAVEGEDPLTCETESSCTGSCSTCGGCH